MLGEVYTSGNRSNMHLGQIFVLGGYRQDDLYSGKMTNVNGKLELNLTTSNYYHLLRRIRIIVNRKKHRAYLNVDCTMVECCPWFVMTPCH
jgi:hypothetical protein